MAKPNFNISIPGFTVEEEYARGGYGILYRGTARGKTCLVKVLKSDAIGAKLGDADRVFYREGTTLARLRHPSVVQVFEVGRSETHTYVVMEYVEGSTLSTVLAKGLANEDLIVEWAKSLAGALAEVHRCGLVHRDIKPDNIIIDKTNTARLIDFGFAAEITTQLKQKEVVGSFRYTAPEQTGMLDRVVDGRSDLYSLGVVLFEAATGRPPFRADDVAQLIHEHATVKPPAVNQVNPNVSSVFSLIVEKLLAKDPDDRYQSAFELRADLEKIHQLTSSLAKGRMIRLGDGGQKEIEASRLPLVGRERESQELTQSWNRAREGHGSLQILEGDAGFGKSRLARELESKVRHEEAWLATAKCINDNPIPLAAWREIVDSLVANIEEKNNDSHQYFVDKIKKAAGDFLPHVCHFSPKLKSVVGILAEEATVLDIGEQFSHVLAQFLICLAREVGGLLVSVEDINWMDSSSSRVLKHLAKEGGSAPLLVLCTCRSENNGNEIVRELSRECGPKLVRTIHVSILSDLGVGALIRSLLGDHQVDDSAVAQIAFRTKGNPFAIIEYVRTLLEEGLFRYSWGEWTLNPDELDSISLSADLLGLVFARIGKLNKKTQQILSAAAIFGSEFSSRDVSEIVGMKLHEVRFAINEAFRARLIERIGFDAYRFVHDRVREALSQKISPNDKRLLHQQIAQLLDGRYQADLPTRRDPAMLYALAYHCYEGGAIESKGRAYETNLEAGLLAAQEFATQEAYDFLSRARILELELGRIPDLNLLQGLGAICFHLDKVDEGVESLRLALKLAKNRLIRSRIRVRLATGYLSRLNIKEARAEIFAAFEDLHRPFPASGIGQAVQFISFGFKIFLTLFPGLKIPAKGSRREMHRIMVELYNVGTLILYHNFEDLVMLQFSLRAFYSARRVGPSREMVSAYSRFAGVLAVMGLKGVARWLANRAIGVADAIHDKKAMAEARIFQAFAIEFAGEPAEAEELFRSTLQSCERWLDHNQYMDASFNTVMALRARGYMREVWVRLEKALDRAKEAFTPEGSGFVIFPSYKSATLATLGRMSEAMEAQRDVEKFLPTLANDKFNWTFYLIQRMILALETGEGQSGIAVLDKFFRDRIRVAPWRALYHVRYYFLYHTYACLTFCYRENGGVAQDEVAITRFERALKELHPSRRMPIFKGHYYLLMAHREFLRKKIGSAHRFLRRAEEAANLVDQPWVTFEVQWLRARILSRSGNRSAARRMASIAYQLAQDAGWVNRARHIWLEFSLDVGSQTSAASSQGVGSGVFSNKSTSARLKRQLKALKEISVASASVLEPIPLARIALDKVIGIVNAERAFMFVRDEKTGQLRMEAGRNSEGENLTELKGFSSTVVRMAEADRKPVLIAGTEEGPVLASQSIVSNQLKSIAAVPLVLKEKLLGVMYLDTRLSKGAFSLDDLEVLNAIASHIAVSFETSRVAQMELERRKIKSAFQQYVSPEIVESLLKDPERLTLGSERRELTVLFSDIRNFTAVSESLPPERLFELMNNYFTPMTKIILKSNGVIDKYIGDAMMAFWGAPLRLLDHADRAAIAALKMMEGLIELNKELVKKGFPAIEMGIGLNTGVMSVGNVGSEERFSYTVLGDSVNLGSRLEGLTKIYGVPIVLSEFTKAKFQQLDFNCRDLDDVRVKGKQKPLKIYELLPSNYCQTNVLEFVALFAQGREAYRNQDWDKAEKLFSQCLAIKYDDRPSQLYLSRLSKYASEPPPKEWDGVTVFVRE